jgi:hypothetical protein
MRPGRLSAVQGPLLTEVSPDFLSETFRNDSSMSSSLASPLTSALERRDLAVALRHQVGDIHLQLLSQVSERPELRGASGAHATARPSLHIERQDCSNHRSKNP